MTEQRVVRLVRNSEPDHEVNLDLAEELEALAKQVRAGEFVNGAMVMVTADGFWRTLWSEETPLPYLYAMFGSAQAEMLDLIRYGDDEAE